MKQFCIVILIGFLCIVSNESIYAQIVNIYSDTTWVYDFSDPKDSVLFSKRLILHTDTIEELVLKENRIEIDWNVETQEWKRKTRRSSHYDLNGNRIYYAVDDWGEPEDDWIPSTRSFYAYDSAEREIAYSGYKWDSDEGAWIGVRKEKHLYYAG